MTEDLSFKPAGPVRPRQLYLSRRLFQALGYVAKSELCSREDVAERIMTQWIEECYPDVVAHLDSMDAAEGAFMKKLLTKKATDA